MTRTRYADLSPEQRRKVIEATKRWQAANPEKYRERLRRWRAANPEKAREGNRRWRAANAVTYRETTRRWHEAHPGRSRIPQLWRNHGLRPEGWRVMWDAQDGLCYLCGEPLPDDPAKVHIDHDHRCCGPGTSCRACRRGLAHNRCNQLIGLADDDPARLRRIAANLRAAQRRIKPLLPAQPVLFTVPAEAHAPPRRPAPNGHRKDPDPGQWETMTLW